MDEDQETNQLPGTHNYAENEATTPTNQEETCSITEKEKAFLTSLEVDDKLQLGSDDYEHMLRSEDTAGSNSTSETSETDLVSAVQSAYNSSNFQNFTDYKQNLNLPEGWQLLTTGYNSRGNGYFGTALWNKKLRIIWIVHMATCFTYFNLLSINLLLSMWQALFRLDLGIVKMLLYEAQIKSAMTFTDNVKQMVQSNEDYLDIKLCVSDNSVGSWLARLSTYSAEHLRVKQQANKKYHFTRAKEITPNVHQQPFRIAVDDHLQLSDPNFSEKIHPTNTDNETFLRQSPFPRPKEMAMFAKAAYVELSTPNYEEELHLPDGWTFLTAVFNNSWGNCYFGVAFWNPALHQIVVAHRGTSPSLFNLKRNWSILYKTDYVGISKVQYVPQVNSAITFAEKIREAIADKPSIRLNFTGHSLGGWLAQVTTFSIKYLTPQADKNHFTLCPNSAKSYHPHTVVFETPGCKEMLLKMKTDFSPKYQTKVNIEKRLDITVYLSKPNLINTSNTHVGTIYAFNGNLYEWVDRLSFVSYIFQTHSIEHIVNAFASNSDDSELVQVVSDFPSGKDQRHNLEKCDDTSCSLSLFSEQELCLLNILETLQTEVKNLTANCYIEKKVAKLPKIALDGDSYKLKLTDAKDLNDVVKFTKQSTTICLNEVLKACNLNTFDVTHKDLQFMDKFGLKEFILQSNQKLLQLVVDNLIVISAIHSILENCRVNNQIDSTLYLKWSHLEKVLKFTDISVIFSMASVVIIETEQSSGFTKDIIKYTEQNEIEKCILILLSNAGISENATLKVIRIEDLDLEKTSQEKLLIEALSQNRPDISAMDVFYQGINEEIHLKNVTRFLETEENTKFFVSCSSKEDLDANLDKQGITEEFEKAKSIKIFEGQENELMKDFKKFCQENHKERVICLEIAPKHEAPSKVCMCKCIYDRNLCIPRQLQSKGFINKDSIKKLKDLCIIVIEKNNNLAEALREELSQTENIIFVSSKEEAEEVSKTKEAPHHILKFACSGQIEFEHSVKSLSNIQSYIDHNFISEDDFVTQTGKTVIIADVPGIGKTTTCSILLHKLSQPPVIYFDLKKCTEGIQRLDKNLDLDVAIQFLLKHICHDRSMLDKSLIKKYLKENLRKSNNSMVLTLLLDGFDEIPQSELHSKLLNLLQFLSHETSARIWVTTRTHYLNMLESGLLVLSTTFQKISESVQKDYLKNNWEAVLKLQLNSDEELKSDLNRHTDKLYSTARQVLDASIGQLMGIPLQMRMLLEVARPKCVEGQIDKSVFEVNNVVSLYKDFVKLKFKIYFESKSCSSKTDSEKKILKKACLRTLQNLALHNHFDDEAENLLTDEEKSFENLSECHRLGLIHQTNTNPNNVEFLHLTFQEYFCAQKLFELISDKCSPDITDLLLSKVLLNEYFTIIRMFLNHQLQTGKVKKEDGMFVEHISKIWKQDRHRLFDEDGNSCFSILATENHVCLTEFLITVLGDFAVEMLSMQNRREETPLAIAIKRKYFTLAETILDKVPLNSRNQIVESTIFFTGSYKVLSICKLETYNEQYFENLEEYLTPNFLKNVDNLLKIDSLLSKSDFFKNEALLVAAFYGYYETVEHLVLKQMKYLDYSNCEGQTALHLAAQKGHFQIVQLLLEQGASCQTLDYTNKSFLHYAVEYSPSADLETHYKYIEIILVCFKLKDIELGSKRNEALLQCIISYCKEQTDKQKNFLELLDLLLHCGVDINKTEKNKRTLLMYACKNILIDVVEYLINKGAKVNLTDKTGKTAIEHAINVYDLTETEQSAFSKILERKVSNSINPSDKNIKLFISANIHCLKEVVEYLISHGVDVNAEDEYGRTALLSVIDQYRSNATTKEIYKVVNILTKNGAHINDFKDSITILRNANQHTLDDMVKYLISKGANVNKGNQFHKTPLHSTLKPYLYNNRNIQKPANINRATTLFDTGMNVDTADNNGFTPLMLASQKSLHQVIEYLIAEGADVNATDKNGLTALHHAVYQNSSYKKEPQTISNTIKILIKNGANADVVTKKGFTPLMLACKYGLHDAVEYLISNGANVNATHEAGRTALHCAIEQIRTDNEGQTLINIVKILIENSVNIDAADNDGYTPLMLSSVFGLPEVTEYLISKGANVNARNQNGRTSLHFALHQTHECKKKPNTMLHVVKILTGNGTDINVADEEGITLLMLASIIGLPKVVKYLISNGANVHITDKHGNTTLHYAVSQTSDKKEPQTIINVARILMENKANIDAANKIGITSLLFASQNDLPEVVKYLISNGADVNTTDELDWTALHFAVYQTPDEKEPQKINQIANTSSENGDDIDVGNKKDVSLPLATSTDGGFSEVNRTKVNFTNRYEWSGQIHGKKEPNAILDVTEFLTKQRANIEAANKKILTPFTLKSFKRLPEVVEYLIRTEVIVNATGEYSHTLNHSAVSQTTVKKEPQTILNVVRILIANGANVDVASKEGVTPLMLASLNGLPEVVEYLISNGANVNTTDEDSVTALHFTADQTLVKKEPQTILNVVRILIANGANVDVASKEGVTPLMFASHFGLPEVVEYLISNGANVNTTNEYGQTALIYAVSQTTFKKEPQTILNVVRILIANGANVDVASKEGVTPLMLASHFGLPEVVEYLISNGANVNTTDKSGWTALHFAADQTLVKKEPQTILNVVRILIANGANVDVASKNSSTPLMLASRNGLPEVVKYLISNGANVNTTGEDGRTALHFVVIQTVKKEPQTILNVVRILIANGANVDVASKNSSTPLMVASLNGLPEVVQYLISNGANVNTTGEDGRTALIYAVSQTVKKEPQTILNVVRILIANGANVNAANKKGATPLMLASLNGLPEVVEYLISNRANVNTTDKSGWTALHFAADQTLVKKEPQTILNVVRILIANGANVDVASKEGVTPLMLASLNGLPEVVEYLISNGANVNTTGEDGRTALHFAVIQTTVKKEPETILNVARILIENGTNVDAADKQGNTPLILASLNGLLEVVEYLISIEANVNISSEHCSTALLAAVDPFCAKKTEP